MGETRTSDGVKIAYDTWGARDGSPVLAILACLLPDGGRTWANADDRELLVGMTAEEWCGRPVTLRTGGRLDLAA